MSIAEQIAGAFDSYTKKGAVPMEERNVPKIIAGYINPDNHRIKLIVRKFGDREVIIVLFDGQLQSHDKVRFQGGSWLHLHDNDVIVRTC